MTCPKDTAITLGVLLTVVMIVSGVMFDQITRVNAELDKRTEIVYSIPAMQNDIRDIKQDIKEIKQDIKELIKK